MKSTRLFATAFVFVVAPMLGCAKTRSQPDAAYPDLRAQTMGQTELQAPSPTSAPADETPACPDPPATEPGALVAVRPDGTPVAAKDILAPSATAPNPKCVPAPDALPAWP
jgi:hypothetical protein